MGEYGQRRQRMKIQLFIAGEGERMCLLNGLRKCVNMKLEKEKRWLLLKWVSMDNSMLMFKKKKKKILNMNDDDTQIKLHHLTLFLYMYSLPQGNVMILRDFLG